MTVSNPHAVVLVANLEPPLVWDSTSGKVKLNSMRVTASPVVEAGGFVANTGGTVTLDNITVTSTGTGNAFTLKTVSGTLSCDISAWCTYGSNADTAQYGSSRAAVTLTTTATHPLRWTVLATKVTHTCLLLLIVQTGKRTESQAW